jgi:hypothetical protein
VKKFDNKGNPAKHAHYVWTGNEEAIIQVQFIGLGGIDYINPADDPRDGPLLTISAGRTSR